MVPNAEEHLAAALKRAARVMPSTKLKNEAAKARNKASRKMDGTHPACLLPWHAQLFTPPLHGPLCLLYGAPAVELGKVSEVQVL